LQGIVRIADDHVHHETIGWRVLVFLGIGRLTAFAPTWWLMPAAQRPAAERRLAALISSSFCPEMKDEI
jgi:hypothetical protein